MKKILILTFAATSFVFAQTTTFNDAAVTDSYVTTAGNWTSGLPTGGTTGTISVSAGIETSNIGGTGPDKDDPLNPIIGYDIQHNAGTVSRMGGLGGLRIQGGTTWVASGTASYSGLRGLSVTGGSSFTVEAGADADFSNNNNREVTASGVGSSVTVNGGTLTSGDGVTASNSGTFTLNSGSVVFSSSTSVFGGAGFSAGNGSHIINGGTLTAQRLGFQSGTTLTLGGSSAGTATFETWGSGNGTNSGDRQRDQAVDIDFLSGSLVTLSMGSAARALNFNDGNGDSTLAWAEALWETDRLFYAGQNSTDLGGLSWADASNSSVGVGGGEYFDFTSAGTYGGSLQLAAAIPEPTSIALIGAGLAMLAIARKRRA